jgi:tetratricopeptide (TPR) repeat protein
VVLRLAKALQISDDERDALLLAAGFPPEGNQVQTSGGDESIKPEASLWNSRSAILIAVASTAMLIGLAAMSLTRGNPVARIFVSQPKPAATGETLILVSEFSNYGNERIGFNVSGRLIDAIRDELDDSMSTSVRVERLHEVVAKEEVARIRGTKFGATLVIWGEFDSGRVIVHSTAPDLDLDPAVQGREWFLSSSEELTTIINSELPQEIRWEVLHILGQTYYLAGEVENARDLFGRATQVQTEDPSNHGLAYFFLGLIESQQEDADLDSVITYYSEAIASRPKLVSALNNRAIAYLERGSPGDLERARDDFEHAIELLPSLYAATHNLAVTLFHISPESLEEPIELLKHASELNPDSPSSPHALCWYLTLEGNPQAALPYCDRAFSLAPSGVYIESRAVTHAKLGEYETAILELEQYLDYLESQSPEEFKAEAPLVTSWIEMLELGIDPFDRETILTILR